jgi:hypothetical protein
MHHCASYRPFPIIAGSGPNKSPFDPVNELTPNTKISPKSKRHCPDQLLQSDPERGSWIRKEVRVNTPKEGFLSCENSVDWSGGSENRCGMFSKAVVHCFENSVGSTGDVSQSLVSLCIWSSFIL